MKRLEKELQLGESAKKTKIVESVLLIFENKDLKLSQHQSKE
ncbi:MAG: hypothetical protein CM15mP70_16750 [Pelagibacteraceae bacterium]|nr:MAG: hypothetical protein CM15mP70_16750 [Pelagibacteraceae bacterium]